MIRLILSSALIIATLLITIRIYADQAPELETNRSHFRLNDRISITPFKSFGHVAKELRCGRQLSTYNLRIVDGKVASIAEFPWMVSLQRERNLWFGFKTFGHSCGASIITPSWLITAAHCFYNKENNNVRAVAGTDNLNFMRKAQIRTVSKVIVHPGFDSVSFNNDIALLRIDQPYDLQSQFSRLGAICLEKDVPVITYDIATVCGFGARAFHKGVRTHLYETDIAIIDQRTCNESFSGAITDNMICAGGMVARKRDACSGDSGGPLMLENEDHLSLIGLVSFGNSCATKNFPGIYTRVNEYIDWVLEQIDEPLIDP